LYTVGHTLIGLTIILRAHIVVVALTGLGATARDGFERTLIGGATVSRTHVVVFALPIAHTTPSDGCRHTLVALAGILGAEVAVAALGGRGATPRNQIVDAAVVRTHILAANKLIVALLTVDTAVGDTYVDADVACAVIVCAHIVVTALCLGRTAIGDPLVHALLLITSVLSAGVSVIALRGARTTAGDGGHNTFVVYTRRGRAAICTGAFTVGLAAALNHRDGAATVHTTVVGTHVPVIALAVRRALRPAPVDPCVCAAAIITAVFRARFLIVAIVRNRTLGLTIGNVPKHTAHIRHTEVVGAMVVIVTLKGRKRAQAVLASIQRAGIKVIANIIALTRRTAPVDGLKDALFAGTRVGRTQIVVVAMGIQRTTGRLVIVFAHIVITTHNGRAAVERTIRHTITTPVDHLLTADAIGLTVFNGARVAIVGTVRRRGASLGRAFGRI
jgi:hypothetical protein